MMKPRCVVVDSDADCLDRVKRTFVASGIDFEVLPFANSVEAAECVRSGGVDLILTAYLLPQIDGLQFISLVRSFDADVPIVMLSGVPVEAAALARGATAFVPKSAIGTEFDSLLVELATAPRI